MALESEVLVNNYGLPHEFAQNFLRVTKGDLEAAIRIIEAAEKDIFVLKAKFISNKRMSHGGIVLFYNFQTNISEYILAVVSSDAMLAKIRVENPWQEFYQDLEKYMMADEAEADYSSKIENEILYQDNASYISSFFIDQSEVDLVNIKRFLLSEISKIMLDTGIVLKVISETTDIFRFKNFIKTVKLGLKAKTQASMDWIVLLNIKVEPVLAPIGGQDIDKSSPGDEILVKINDNREIVQFVVGLLQTDTTPGTLYGRLVYNQKDRLSQNNLVILEFGAGIFGRFLIGEKIRVQVREKKADIPIPSKTDDAGKKVPVSTSFPEIVDPTRKEPVENNSRKTEENEPKKPNYYPFILIGAVVLVIVFLIILLTIG